MTSLRESISLKDIRVSRRHSPESPRPSDGGNGRSPAMGALTGHRAISLMAALGLFWPLAKAWNDIVAVPSAGLAVVALTGGVLWLVIAIATAKTELQLERLDRWLLLVAVLVLVAWLASILQTETFYATDEASFEQGAANLLLHGHNPYGVNLSSYLAAFSTPSRYLTYTMTGGTVSTFGYPALPLLVAAPFVQLTGGGQAVPIADIVVLVAATVVAFKLLPKERRGAAVMLCVAFPILGEFALSGLNVVLAMAALLPTAARWTTTGERGSLSRGDRFAAACLGLALATNQLVWFIAPFPLLGMYLIRSGSLGARQARRVMLGFLGWSLAVFAVVNAPFFVSDPGAWLSGVAAPLTQHAIPYGQGVVGLTLFLRMGGGALYAYDYAAALLYVALLILYAVRFRMLARAAFALPILALFISGRSLAEYWMAPVVVIALSILAADDQAIARAAQLGPRGRRLSNPSAQRAALAGLLFPAAVCLGIALATPQPLTVRILSAQSSRSLDSVRAVQVLVRNGSGRALRPHFATNVSGQAVVWGATSGPAVLPPGGAATYWLVAPDGSSMPPNGTPFVVEALTGSPSTISSSASFVQRGQVPGSW